MGRPPVRYLIPHQCWRRIRQPRLIRHPSFNEGSAILFTLSADWQPLIRRQPVPNELLWTQECHISPGRPVLLTRRTIFGTPSSDLCGTGDAEGPHLHTCGDLKPVDIARAWGTGQGRDAEWRRRERRHKPWNAYLPRR